MFMKFRFLCYNSCMVLLQWVRISWNHHFESFSGFQCPNRFDFFVLIRSTHKVLFFCHKGVWICYNGTQYHEIAPWSRFRPPTRLVIYYIVMQGESATRSSRSLNLGMQGIQLSRHIQDRLSGLPTVSEEVASNDTTVKKSLWFKSHNVIGTI